MQISRTQWTDWYVDGDESAVYVDCNVIVLSALATRLLAHVDGTVSTSDLAAMLVVEFGAPDDLEALVATEATVRELIGVNVLVEADR